LRKIDNEYIQKNFVHENECVKQRIEYTIKDRKSRWLVMEKIIQQNLGLEETSNDTLKQKIIRQNSQISCFEINEKEIEEIKCDLFRVVLPYKFLYYQS
jgi:ABC-type sugar transport system ATPase subunit